MITQFFQTFSKLEAHHQLIFSLFIFIAVQGIWWSGYMFFDTFFFANSKTMLRLCLAFLFGGIVLAIVQQFQNALV